MISNIFSERRNIMQAFAVLSLASASSLSLISRVAFGQAVGQTVGQTIGGINAEAADGAPDAPADEKKGGKDAGKKGKGTLLTVAVSGNGMPIAQAEVKIKFQKGADDEMIRPTNQAGEAKFESAGTGIAKVRVIAKGWQTKGQDVSLTEEPQRVMISLTPQG
jgi:hypothetical protein